MIKVAVWSQKDGVGNSTIVSLKENAEEASSCQDTPALQCPEALENKWYNHRG